MTLFQNKYRIELTRLKNWNYASAGWYFVTICTRNREYFFGDVVDGEMLLSETGGLVADEWLKTRTVRKNIELDQWVVMPNHIHGIVIINNPVETSRWDVSGPAKHNPEVPTVSKPGADLAELNAGLETRHRRVSTKVQLQSGSLGAIINQFKSVCTKQIRLNTNKTFDWQPRFYDHIIRSDKSLKEIRE